ncbi:unnamed protein product [Ilex paraguariensis]|uniref:Uncharacterized protein n=1 Tax=Ilex paraguariensis TaxID=185542 RepID=A0ABC8RX87_9AQUA
MSWKGGNMATGFRDCKGYEICQFTQQKFTLKEDPYVILVILDLWTSSVITLQTVGESAFLFIINKAKALLSPIKQARMKARATPGVNTSQSGNANHSFNGNGNTPDGESIQRE